MNKDKYFEDKFVLVYQMGKVASNTISATVKNAGYSTWSSHSFGKYINNQIFYKYKNPNNRLFKERMVILSSRLKAWVVLNMIKRRRENLKVITLFRDPISRNEAFFFQDLHIPLSQMSKRDWKWVNKGDNMDLLTQEYFEKLNHTHGIDWFDIELKRFLGIDVYDHPFDKESSYTIIKKKNIELLVIKLEKLNDCACDALSEFLNEENIQLENRNVGSDKWYSALYKEFKGRVEYSREYVENLYDSKYMKHFYTDEEIGKFKDRLKISD